MKQWNHAIISGGGSGIGLGLACRLLKRGVNVSIIDLAVSDAAWAELESAAEQGGSAWVFHRADLTVEKQVFEAVGKATMLLARHTPALFNRFMNFNIRRFMRRFGQLQPA